MGLSTGMAANTVLTGLDKIFFGEFDKKPGPNMASVEDAGVFRQESVNNRGVQSEIFKDAGKWDERSDELEDLAEGTARTGYNRTFTVANYAQSISIPKHYFDDEMYGVVSETIRKMAKKGALTRLNQGMAIYRGGFATTTVNEGSYLYADSHTNLNGDTVDNKLTAALSTSALDSAVKMLIEQKDQAGDVVGHEAKCLLVPPALFPDACKITESTLEAGTAENDMNIYSAKYGIIVKQSNYLGSVAGGSNTAWFLNASLHPVYRWVRQAAVTDIVDYKYANNFVYKYKAEYREVFGAPTYEGTVASTGAAA